MLSTLLRSGAARASALKATSLLPAMRAFATAAPFPAAPKNKDVYLVSSGDLRQPSNKTSWPTQKVMEEKLTAILQKNGYKVIRAHQYDPAKGHGFLDSQRAGLQTFEKIPSNARVLVAESIWQYSHHVLSGLLLHKGPILTVANFHGAFAGLVGMLNLNGCLTKFGMPFSTLWSEEFNDKYFTTKLVEWLKTGKTSHDVSHSRPLNPAKLPAHIVAKAKALNEKLLKKKIIMGVFDEGCMGMANAILEDHLINKTGIFKERLSQSALYAEMLKVSEAEAMAIYEWLVKKGFTFHFGKDEETELTLSQVLQQCKMYIAAVRIANDFKCDIIGIQYQQGLKDLTPASDLVEGLLNNVDRPPVYDEDGNELFAGQALPHFNEVDEGAGVDAIITNWIWKELGLDPATTLHDIRWGDYYTGGDINNEFIWIFLISGAAPPSHFAKGYAGAHGWRQDNIAFRLGGSTVGGVSKPGEIVWSRVYAKNMEVNVDLGRATVVDLPEEEVQRRLNATTPTWPIMNAKLHGVTRDQMMARHPANHVQVAYGKDAKSADEALAFKAAMFHQMGFKVHLCGKVNL